MGQLIQGYGCAAVPANVGAVRQVAPPRVPGIVAFACWTKGVHHVIDKEAAPVSDPRRRPVTGVARRAHLAAIRGDKRVVAAVVLVYCRDGTHTTLEPCVVHYAHEFDLAIVGKGMRCTKHADIVHVDGQIRIDDESHRSIRHDTCQSGHHRKWKRTPWHHGRPPPGWERLWVGAWAYKKRRSRALSLLGIPTCIT